MPLQLTCLAEGWAKEKINKLDNTNIYSIEMQWHSRISKPLFFQQLCIMDVQINNVSVHRQIEHLLDRPEMSYVVKEIGTTFTYFCIILFNRSAKKV